MNDDELAQIKINLRAAYERGKTGEALAAARRQVADRRAGRGEGIDSLAPAAKPSEAKP